ncbi:MAG: hypothetical protein WCY19_05195 [Candidatus Gastranaerophilaceae bacterium]
MVRIRKANYFDKFKLKKMISFLSSDAISHYTKVFMNFPFNTFHDFLPLNLKFLPESYVIEENKDIIGMVTVSPTHGNPFKLVISRLFLEHDYFNAGKQLIEFVISKYGAKGANTFTTTIDDSYDELLHLFAGGCGFRQCSSEQLWKMDEIRFGKSDNTFFRPFKNSDAQAVAMLFNDSIITHFKYSISRTKDEYLEPILKGLSDECKFKYVIEDENLKTVKAYFSITTGDNLNYILDVASSAWYECSWDDILNFAINQISKRKKEFYLFVKVKKYTATAENFEKYLTEKGFKCIQNQLVLVKDFYKIIKEPQPLQRVVLFNEINEKPVFKV